MKLSYTTYRLECTHPFGISRSTFNHYDRVFIYLEQDGFIGRGEAAPSERYNESIPQILERLQHSIDLPNKVINITKTIDIFDKMVGDIKSLRSACVNALYDWWMQKNNTPLYKYFNYNKNISRPTSFTIAIGDYNELQQKIEEAQDYQILKVKLGTKEDKEIISTIRKYTDKPICVDANEGWDLKTAIDMSKWLEKQNVELIEQPLPTSKLSEMSELKAVSPLPLIADENCHTSADIENIMHGFDGINIKMAKCGGLDEALKMIEIAQDNGLLVMLGCMVESSIGITALGQVASRADFLDLDGNLLIENNPYCGITIKNGIPVLPSDNGLGLKLKTEYQEKYPDLK